MPYPPGAHDIARLTRLTQRGGIVAIAIDDSSGTVIGSSLIDVASNRPAGGEPADVGELAAVGVLAAFRRRGIASALSAHLARTAHSQGIGLVFLEARTRRGTALPPHRVHRCHQQDLGLDPLSDRRPRCLPDSSSSLGNEFDLN